MLKGRERESIFLGQVQIYIARTTAYLRNDASCSSICIIPVESKSYGSKKDDTMTHGYIVVHRPHDYKEGNSPWDGVPFQNYEEVWEYISELLGKSIEELEEVLQPELPQDVDSKPPEQDFMHNASRIINDIWPSAFLNNNDISSY